MDSLVRKALLGDREAQRECTEKGIVLPCPLCGGKATMQQDITGGESYHVVCSNVKDMCNLVAGLPMWSESEEDALKVWNTRPAPPIGRCGECKNFKKHKNFTHPEYMFDGECKRFKSFNSEYAFCSCFEPREE